MKNTETTKLNKYKIDIIFDKKEISEDFLIIVYSEEIEGSYNKVVKRAKALQKEWNAELYSIEEVK